MSQSAWPASATTQDAPAGNAEAVTIGTPLVTESRGLYIGVGGNVLVVMSPGGNQVLFKGAQAGSILPIRISSVVSSASTTATDLVALS